MSRLLRRSLVIALVVAGAAGCGRSATVPEAIEVYDLKTGYDDGGREAGQNRLLPTVAFKVRNKATRAVLSVEFKAVVGVIGDNEELGALLVLVID